jgi:transposase
MPQTRFTKEFRDEAVRLALTSGRSRREIAADLGVGLSTLRHWLDRRREREIDDPPEERQEDMATELKRLRRENEILRQEREILKKATMDSTGQRTMIDFLVSERIHDGAYGAAGLIGGAEKGTLGPVESWRVAERHRPCSWQACRVSLWRRARQGRHCSTAEDTLSAFAHV